jgi:hypothetical protein
MGMGFYKGGFVPSPKFHYQAIHDLGEYARNALGAPRGTAKSTVVAIEIPLLMLLTRPHYSIALCLSIDSLVEARFDTIMTQLTDNALIIQDFGVQKPLRGAGIWHHHHLHLINGSVLQGFSVMGRKRGLRPHLFLLDDPENDPDSDSATAQHLLTEKFERILFRQIIPMLEYGSAIFWIGTLINRRAFLYNACCTDDPRFNFWNRRVLSAGYRDPTTQELTSVLWNEKWPAEVLEARRAEIGAAAFAAEYENNPISDEERTLHIDRDLNEYVLTGQTSAGVPDDPWGPDLRDFLANLFIIGTFDYASGLGPHSDYSCLLISGFDTNNTLWLLDMWMGRAKEYAVAARYVDGTC